MKRYFSGSFWISVYLAFSLSPLFFVVAGEAPPGRDFITELSIGFGLVGLAMLGLQFALTARFRRVAAPFGIDIILQFHRQISIFAFLLILAHPILLVIRTPETIYLFNPVEAPWRARFATLSLLALIGLLVTSIWRERLRLRYEAWKITHAALAVIAVGGALAHIIGVGYYVALPWQQALWIFMSAGTVVLLLYIRVGKPLLMRRRPLRVREVLEERGASRTIVLQREDGGEIRFQPGQFAWLKIWTSPFGFEEHPFSFSSSSREPERPAVTVKELGDFTRELRKLETGTRVYMDGPYGAFTHERYEAPGFVFLAGGVGITPIMSMLRSLRDWGDTRPLLLIYGNATWEEVTFREELDSLREGLELTVVHLLEDPPEGWEGEVGFVDAELLRRHLPMDQLHRRQYFVCGPGPMMDASEAALAEIGVRTADVHTERFELV